MTETFSKTVALIVFDDYTDIDLILTWDLLKRVHLDGWQVRILGTQPEHRSMTGLTTLTHGTIDEARHADAVVFGSGKGNRPLVNDADYLARLQLDPERQLITSICSGALFLGALGLLAGKRATTYPSAKPLLEAYGVKVVEEPFVVQGNVATAGGCFAAQYLVGWILEQFLGESIRDAVIASAQPVGEGLYFSTEVEAEQKLEQTSAV
ncbi:DJ-1/PfpI family protein [Acanthopleuribacter pedis]|uniref:DJ-1/PfpI family protein n=1 Tax=Acanthopleuribacter pedis TaxID=442870 RepID=A0A8J7U5L0_9BACT|nr:DJ-1/PfpI family protein [Acanthopleuribacter pedis]MBO1319431.1 DJ-1/PfpI family protein [Acanthopleuribacter pedis]